MLCCNRLTRAAGRRSRRITQNHMLICSLAAFAVMTSTTCKAMTIIDFNNLAKTKVMALGSNAARTPEIADSHHMPGVKAELDTWDGYGDFIQAAYAASEGRRAYITLTPSTGSQSVLNSFQLAGYYGRYPNQTLEVADNGNEMLWDQSGTVPGATPAQAIFTPSPSSSTPLQFVFGPNSDAGINIRFDDVSGVPEPATWALLIAGFGMIGAAMRRRNKRLMVVSA